MHNFFTRTLRRVRELRERRREEEAALRRAARAKKAVKTRADLFVEERRFTMRALKVIVLLIVVGFTAYLIYEIRGTLFMFFVAFLIASAVDPLTVRLKQYRIPKSATYAGVILLFFVGLTLFASRLVPLFSGQLIDLAQKIGNFFARLQSADVSQFPIAIFRPVLYEAQKAVELGNIQTQLQDWLQLAAVELFKLKDNVWQIFKVVSAGLVQFLLIILIAYLMLAERSSLNNFLFSMVPQRYEAPLVKNLAGIREKMGAWLWGRLLLSLAVGFLTYLVLLILGIPSALTLGVMMGIFDIVPIVGPTLAWLLILPVAANISFFTVAWMTIGVLAVQWIENNFLIPYIMKKTMGIPSIAVVFALLVGNHFFGIIGLVLAVPVAAMIALVWADYVRGKAQI